MGSAHATTMTPLSRDEDIHHEEVEDSSIHGTEDVVSEPSDQCDAVGEDSVDGVDISMYDFPFENIVFEGGGTKGLAYCGAIQVLEEDGIIDNIQRIAGTSAGAITAAFLAVGFSSADIRVLMDEDLYKLMNDHWFGYLSVLPNVFRKFGWNSGNRFLEWFGGKLSSIGADPDITFKQVLKEYGKELCIVVTNVDRMAAEYFHPKTTPDVPIRVAVRMSIAIPVFFQAFQHDFYGSGQVDTYVDGGVLCNYPISCFDGWWLSMEPEDSFLHRLSKLEELPRMFEKKIRFGKYNDKTLGFMVYAEEEKDLLRTSLEDCRKGTGPSTVPKTKLGRKHLHKLRKRKQKEGQISGNRQNLETALEAFYNALECNDKDHNSSIDMEELRNALEDEGFRDHKALLFGENATAEDVMNALDANHDGTVRFGEIKLYLDHKGFSMSSKFLGYGRNVVTDFISYLKTLQSALSYNVQRLFVEEEDVKRTVGINTCYIGTRDFVLEEADKEYLIQQGRKSTKVFLRTFVEINNPPLKEASSRARKCSSYDAATMNKNEDKGSVVDTDKENTVDHGLPVDIVNGVPGENTVENNDIRQPNVTDTPGIDLNNA